MFASSLKANRVVNVRTFSITRAGCGIACVAWRFLSNLKAAIRSAEAASQLVFAASPLCLFAFKLLKPPSYAGKLWDTVV